MTKKSRSSNAVLLVALLVILGVPASTVLLAKGNHNLNRLLIGLGLPPIASPLPVEESEAKAVDVVNSPKPIINIPEGMMDPPLAAPQNDYETS